jgi:hypothetical protein
MVVSNILQRVPPCAHLLLLMAVQWLMTLHTVLHLLLCLYRVLLALCLLLVYC